jgi:hypothetical protein
LNAYFQFWMNGLDGDSKLQSWKAYHGTMTSFTHSGSSALRFGFDGSGDAREIPRSA